MAQEASINQLKESKASADQFKPKTIDEVIKIARLNMDLLTWIEETEFKIFEQMELFRTEYERQNDLLNSKPTKDSFKPDYNALKISTAFMKEEIDKQELVLFDLQNIKIMSSMRKGAEVRSTARDRALYKFCLNNHIKPCELLIWICD